MTLTQDFKNECERILKAWRDLIVSQWGKPWVELFNYNEANKGKIMDDPFFASFKTSRSLEEIAWMNKRIQDYYFDNSDNGIYNYISYAFQNGADNGAVKFIYNLFLIRARFMRNLSEGGLDNLTQQWNQLQDNQEKHTPEQLEKHKPEDLKPTDYEQINADLATAQQATKDKEQELKSSKEQQIAQGSELKNNLFKVSRKLMMLYNEQIKKQTELFYQDLSLDNNLVNEKYGNKDKPYLYYLARTSTETEPEQVISAFRIVVLIVATEQAQIKSDEYKNIASLKAPIKKMNLKRFNKVKDTWETIADQEEPQEANNPLYLPIIKNKNQYFYLLN